MALYHTARLATRRFLGGLHHVMFCWVRRATLSALCVWCVHPQFHAHSSIIQAGKQRPFHRIYSMVNSFIELSKTVDPHLRSWMLFVDGENFTVRGQKFALDNRVALKEGPNYCRDACLWFPGLKPTVALTNTLDTPLQVQPHAIRSYYATSVTGDEPRVLSVRQARRPLSFHPEVFKKPKSSDKAKGVDIALTKDFLSHAFLCNYDVALLVAGDSDYVPLIVEVKRLGKVVDLAFFTEAGLSIELHLTADMFLDMGLFFLGRWTEPSGKGADSAASISQRAEATV
jgi:NYN domain